MGLRPPSKAEEAELRTRSTGGGRKTSQTQGQSQESFAIKHHERHKAHNILTSHRLKTRGMKAGPIQPYQHAISTGLKGFSTEHLLGDV